MDNKLILLLIDSYRKILDKIEGIERGQTEILREIKTLRERIRSRNSSGEVMMEFQYDNKCDIFQSTESDNNRESDNNNSDNNNNNVERVHHSIILKRMSDEKESNKVQNNKGSNSTKGSKNINKSTKGSKNINKSTKNINTTVNNTKVENNKGSKSTKKKTIAKKKSTVGGKENQKANQKVSQNVNQKVSQNVNKNVLKNNTNTLNTNVLNNNIHTTLGKTVMHKQPPSDSNALHNTLHKSEMFQICENEVLCPYKTVHGHK